MNSGIGDDTEYPKKDEFMSKEEYNNAVKKHFKLKGLNHRDDFSENEKKTIVEDCTIRLMGTKMLSQKYNTLPCVISYLVHRAKSSVTPNDLSKFPDFPKRSDGMSDREYQKSVNKYFKYKKLREYRKKNPVILKQSEYPNFPQKSDDMSDEEYKKIRRRFWNKKKRENRQKNKMLKKELEIQNILENYIPEDLTEYPDFPDYLDGVTHEEYAQLVKDFWIKRVRK